MAKSINPADVTISLEKVARILDGSNRTHSVGGTVSIKDGKTYAVYVTRHHVKQTTPWEVRGVHYSCALFLNGRQVREGALVDLKTLILRQVVADMNREIRAALAEAEKAPEAPEADLFTKAAGGANAEKAAVRNLKDQLSTYAYTLDGVDHGAAKLVNQARDDLHKAWRKLWFAEQRLQAQAEGRAIPASCLTDGELARELEVR